MASSRLINRNVTASRGRTSMRLEPELWEALEEICQRERTTLADLVKRIEMGGHPGGRTSAVRVHVLGYFRNAAHLADGGDAMMARHPVNGGSADGHSQDGLSGDGAERRHHVGADGWQDGQSSRASDAA